MRRIHVAAAFAAIGLFVSWAGQGIWRNSPDSLWAAVAVISVLLAAAIALNPTISRLALTHTAQDLLLGAVIGFHTDIASSPHQSSAVPITSTRLELVAA